jgi:hypothetical protein
MSNTDLLFVSKALSAKKQGKTLADRPKGLKPGTHRLRGTINYDITAEVGEDTEADRAFGVPSDDILDLAAHLCGALRPHLHKAAAVATELTRAKLEDRAVRGTSFQVEGETVCVTCAEVRRLATTLAGGTRGSLSGSIKVKRPYVGQIRIKEANVECS